jgi:hypothetical protein
MDNKVRREKKWSGLLTVAGERNCDKVTYELWRPQQHQCTQGFSSFTGIGCFKNRSDVPKLVFPLATRPSVFYFPLRAYVGFVVESLLRFTLTHASTSSCVCTRVCECALYSSDSSFSWCRYPLLCRFLLHSALPLLFRLLQKDVVFKPVTRFWSYMCISIYCWFFVFSLPLVRRACSRSGLFVCYFQFWW